MKLDKENVQKFKQTFREEYGVNYSDDEAREALERLTLFFETLMEIDKRENITGIQKLY